MTRLPRVSWPRRLRPTQGVPGTGRLISSPLLRTPGAALVGVVVLLLVALGVAAQTEPARSGTSGALTPRAKFVPVARASAVCPDAITDATSKTSVMLAAPGAIDDQTPPSRRAHEGSAALRPLDGNGPAVATLTDLVATQYDVAASTRSAQDASDTGADGEPLLATARGALAPGFTASMTTRSTSDDIRGLASTACAAPGNDFWFVGSGAVVGRRGRLYLSNSEAVPAVVDIALYGPDGAITAPSGRGLTLAAGAQEVLKLDALAPDIERFGVHVQVRQGRVAAALRDQQVQGLTPMGADWVPATQPPARRLILPGVPEGPGERHLQVVVPGDSDAIVRVRLIGSDGTFAPSGLDVVEARAGRVSDVDLAPFTGSQPVAVELTSDQPITAGVLARVGGVGKAHAEMGYTAAAAPITAANPAVVTDLRGTKAGKTVTSKLMLAAPDGAATVQINVLAPAVGKPVRVNVPDGTQVTVDADTLSDDAGFAVTLVPGNGSGPVMAARELAEADPSGPLLTVLLVTPSRYAVQVPQVVADLSTGLRRPGARPSSTGRPIP